MSDYSELAKAIMTPDPKNQEQRDLEKLRQEIRAKKDACYSYMESLDRADAQQLETSGYKGKTNAEAMQHAFRLFQREIKKLVDAHVRKYPD